MCQNGLPLSTFTESGFGNRLCVNMQDMDADLAVNN